MSTPGEGLALPIAAIVCLAVGSYVLIIVVILVVRYCLVSRGVCECSCVCGKPEDDDSQSCACCVNLAECCDCCKSPSVTSCLDSICPNRKRMGCVEILLCQCCGSEGAAGACTCCNCCGCPSDCPKCPCICNCDIDCSTITCCCITIHIVASHDQVSSFKHSHEQLDSNIISTQHSFDSLRNNNLQSFTDLNKNTKSQASLELSLQSSFAQDFHNNAPSYRSAQNLNQSAAFPHSVLPYNNGLQSLHGAPYFQHSTLSTVSLPHELPCMDIATQTPHQFPVRQNTLRTVQKRKLKTAKDRYSPREIKSARLARNVMFDPRLVQTDCTVWNNGKPILRNTGVQDGGVSRNLSIQSLPDGTHGKGRKVVDFHKKKIHSTSNVHHW